MTLLLLAGCGTGPTASDDDPPPAGGDEPITARALAAVVAEHTATPSSASPSTDLDEFGRRVAAAVELRIPADGGGDGNSLTIGVGTNMLKNYPATCAALLEELADGCAAVDDGLLFWEEQTSEEDPGVIYLTASRGTTDTILFSSGPSITGDPREIDLPISTEVMLEIARDPRVGVTTSADAVVSGEKIAFWRE